MAGGRASARSVWLPYEMVHANYALPEPPHAAAFPATTNGLASGNTSDEALLHAHAGGDRARRRHALAAGPRCLAQPHRHPPGDRRRSRLPLAARSLRCGGHRCRDVRRHLRSRHPDLRLPDRRSDRHDGCRRARLRHPHGARRGAQPGAHRGGASARHLHRRRARGHPGRGLFSRRARGAKRDGARHPGRAASRSAPSATRARSRRTASKATSASRLQALDRAGIREVIAVEVGKKAFGLAVCRVVVPGLEAAFEGPRSDYVPGRRASALLTEHAA